MSADDFRRYIKLFAATHDPKEHHEMIMALLQPLDLEVEYLKIKNEGGLSKVREVFEAFAEVPADELVGDFERASLRQVGELTSAYFEQKNYRALAQMVFVLVVESLLEFYDVLEDIQVTDTHVAELYEQLADEIYVQLFILEHMSHEDHFDWTRDALILEQSLVALTVCFSDIYAFLSDQDTADMPEYVD